MATCNKEVAGKKGDERKAFMETEEVHVRVPEEVTAERGESASPGNSEQHPPSARPGLLDRLTSEGGAAVVLAAATAFGYLTAVVYERAYLQFFGVPLYFAAPTLPIIATTVVAVLFGAGAFLLNFVNWTMRLKHKAQRHKVLVLGAFLIAAGGLLGIADLPGQAHSVPTMLVVSGLACLVAAIVSSVLTGGRSRADYVFAVSLSMAVTMAITLVFAQVIAYGAAATQTVFYTLVEDRATLIVRSYGDVLVGVRFDRERKRLVSEAMILKQEDGQKIRLYREDLGPLIGYKSTFGDFK